MPKDNDNTFAGLSKAEGAILIAVIALAILAGTNAAINYKTVDAIDLHSDAGQAYAIEVAKQNNQLFGQLIAASFVFLGLGGAVIARRQGKPGSSAETPPGS